MHYSSAHPAKAPADRAWDLRLQDDINLKLQFGQVPGATIVIDKILEAQFPKRVLSLLQRLRKTPFEIGAVVVNPDRKLTPSERRELEQNLVVVLEYVPEPGRTHSERRRAADFIEDFKQKTEGQAANFDAYLQSRRETLETGHL